MNQNAWMIVRPGLAVVDHGPVNMTIEAWTNLRPCSTACQAGALEALNLLKELSQCLTMAKQPAAVWRKKGHCPKTVPKVLRAMVDAVMSLDQEDFTPMAAVAGTFSDLVCESALKAGADRVMVNNGGDLSFFHGPTKKPFVIGISPILTSANPTHCVVTRQDAMPGMGGAATSGLGGRSLTKGIATVITSFATSGSKADAAATSIANATNCHHNAIKRYPAKAVDPMTDLGDTLVTGHVGPIPIHIKQRALDFGIKRAKTLVEKKMILGCFLSVQELYATFPEQIAKPVQEK